MTEIGQSRALQEKGRKTVDSVQLFKILMALNIVERLKLNLVLQVLR